MLRARLSEHRSSAGTYGDAEFQTIVENYGTALILRCSDPEPGSPEQVAESSNVDDLITSRLWNTVALVDERACGHLIVAGGSATSPVEKGFV